jgi:hypothetical protein
MLISQAIRPQSINKATNADTMAHIGFCGTKKATVNAAIARLHQGKYNPNAYVSNAVTTVLTMNFIYTL